MFRRTRTSGVTLKVAGPVTNNGAIVSLGAAVKLNSITGFAVAPLVPARVVKPLQVHCSWAPLFRTAKVAVEPMPFGCTVTVLLAHETAGITNSFPLLTIVSPLYVFTPESVSVPEPIFVRPPLVLSTIAVSYTHLTLPTKRIV